MVAMVPLVYWGNHRASASSRQHKVLGRWEQLVRRRYSWHGGVALLGFGRWRKDFSVIQFWVPSPPHCCHCCLPHHSSRSTNAAVPTSHLLLPSLATIRSAPQWCRHIYTRGKYRRGFRSLLQWLGYQLRYNLLFFFFFTQMRVLSNVIRCSSKTQSKYCHEKESRK